MIFALIVTLLSVYATVSSAQNTMRPPSTGWPTQNWNAWRSMNFSQPVSAESFAYQASTGDIIVGNLAGGASSFPFSNNPNNIAELVLQPRAPTPIVSGQSLGTFGLQTDPFYDTLLWEAIATYPPVASNGNTQATPCVIGVANTTTATQANVFSFPTVNGGVCMVDDLVVSSTTRCVYGTDFYGYRILTICPKSPTTPVTTTSKWGNNGVGSVLSSDKFYLCSDPNSANCGVTNCGSGMRNCNGPNGIVIWTDSNNNEWLLINVLATLNSYYQVIPNGGARLVKMSTTSGAASFIDPGPNTPVGALQGVDGMTIFNYGGSNAMASVLYAVGETSPSGTIQVITSVDGWSTYEMRNVMNSACSNRTFYDTAVRAAGSHLLVMCNNNFRGGAQQMNSFFGFNGISSSPVAITVANTLGSNFKPEGFGYDPNRNMLVMGSVNSGILRGFTYNNVQAGPNPINLYTKDAYVYWNPTGTPYTSTNGVNVNPNNVFGDSAQANCYAIVAHGGFQGAEVGISVINLCASSNAEALVQFVRLTCAVNANDIAVLDNFVYVTDTLGNQVFAVEVTYANFYMYSGKLPLNSDTVRVVISQVPPSKNSPNQCSTSPTANPTFSPSSNAATPSRVPTPSPTARPSDSSPTERPTAKPTGPTLSPSTMPSASPTISASPTVGPTLMPTMASSQLNFPNSLQMGPAFTSPNGIVAVQASGNQPGFIIISSINTNGQTSQQNGNWKFIPSQSSSFCSATNCGTITQIQEPTGIFSNIDGMKFNQYGNLLFGTRNSLNGAAFQSVVVATTCDNWQTAQLAYVFQTTCPNSATGSSTGTNPPAIALIQGLGDLESLVILCNDGLGSATSYPIMVVNYVNTVVANNGFTFCATSTDDDVSTAGKGTDHKKLQKITVGILVAVFVALTSGILYHKYIGSKGNQQGAVADSKSGGLASHEKGHELSNLA